MTALYCNVRSVTAMQFSLQRI